MNPQIVNEIISHLDGLTRAESIFIPLAIESGSRAWGFPSPDSDYDCRFIYIRRHDQYLSLFPVRDVIELPMTPVLDVNGWDLAKALKLLMKGSAVVVEWLTSPISYMMDEVFRREMLALADQVVDRAAVMSHYRHLALGQRALLYGEGGQAKLKKLFYVLRPLVACLWLEARPGRAVAPMHFPTLCDETDMPAALRAQIGELLALKAASREMGQGPVPQELLHFTLQEMQKPLPVAVGPASADMAGQSAVDAFFRRWVRRQMA
jgi:predicted nucleotidyltransferase